MTALSHSFSSQILRAIATWLSNFIIWKKPKEKNILLEFFKANYEGIESFRKNNRKVQFFMGEAWKQSKASRP
jgi:hypothetical protein